MKPSAESVGPVENPYASPRSVETQSDAETLLKATTRLYRRMGWAGAVYCLGVCPFMMIMESTQRQMETAEAIPAITAFGLMGAFFVLMIKTAKDLAVDLDRTYRRARWLGILVAAIAFPILTVPGILAVRRLERYRRFVAAQTDESSRTDRRLS